MSRRSLVLPACAGALVLTAGAWWQVMYYKATPPGALALWLPFIVLFRAHGPVAIGVALLQFPVLAGVFVLASRPSRPRVVLAVMAVFYALCVLCAWLMLEARLWT